MKQMKRRQFLKTSSTALLLPGLLPRWPAVAETPNLFYEASDLARIRTNTQTPLLRNYYQDSLNADLTHDRQEVEKLLADRNLFTGYRHVLHLLRRECLVTLVERIANRRKFALELVDVVLGREKWDYFLADERPLGFQLAPDTVISLLFALEVLRPHLKQETKSRLLGKLADEGCTRCYNALADMEKKEHTTNWRFDPDFLANYDIDMTRWPIILDETNLKAIPCAGLGLGALALMNHDQRAPAWLDMAIHSTREFLSLFSSDGSYFEGVSYADYSMRNLFLFMDAHMKLRGDIDWPDLLNLHGFSEFIATMQIGKRKEAGKIDIVNFSDANRSIHPATALWIVRQTRDPLAQYAAQHYTDHRSERNKGASNFADRRFFSDFLWYEPSIPAEAPSARLLNRRLDLDWIVCRSGWDEDASAIAFRSGMPSNHEHADRNSFIFKAFGERLLTDHYGAAYDWRQPNWILRLTEAHNAVLINGKGHQYHKGEEGTNASFSEARIRRYVDRGDWVWWNSDATQAYALVNRDVENVVRSVLFLKPDILVLCDQLRMRRFPSQLAVRFHPDNTDNQASISIDDEHKFRIQRPNARLNGSISATVKTSLRVAELEISMDHGVFPFAEVVTEKTKAAHVLTVLVSSRKDASQPEIEITRRETGWAVIVDNRQLEVRTLGELPEFIRV